jgi:inorganic pyrophosphatase
MQALYRRRDESNMKAHRGSAALLLAVSAAVLLTAQPRDLMPPVLPPAAATQLAASVKSAAAHSTHLWRDTPPTSGDLVAVYVEIPRGERTKWEFDMRANARAVDRVMPEALGGYPVNYGFVPQTVSYDGDPFDGLVLGPPLPGGAMVHGVIVGLLLMEDEKGLDSKVVVSLTGADGRPLHRLTDEARRGMGDFFDRYKRHEPGKFSKVFGWGTIEEARSLVGTCHAFFKECAARAGTECRVNQLPK